MRHLSTYHKTSTIEPDSATASSGSHVNLSATDTHLNPPQSSLHKNEVRSLLDNFLNASTINKEQLLKVNHLNSNKQLKDQYTSLTYRILEAFYPTYCNDHPTNLLTPGKIKGRQLMGQCSICKAQKSLAKGTPLMNLHLPISYFSYILQEILTAYPSVITAKAIQKKLALNSYSSAWLLKKRIQVFMTHLNDSMMEQTKEALSQEASMNMGSKMPFSGDVSDSIKGRIITNVDTLAIFSVGVRANKFRSRYRHGGITSSIYQSAKVGGAQVGTLASNITIKGSLSFYESHPLTNTDYALSHLEKVITPENVLMADEAYQGLFGHYRNIRTINHSRRANRKIHVFSRERWSKDGVHSNVVEGSNGILKKAMKQYNWFNCKYSQLYLNEYAVGKNIRFFDVEKNVIFGIGDTSKNCGLKIREIRSNNYNSIREFLKNLTYKPISTEERKLGEVGNLRNNLSISELSKLPKLLQDAIKRNDTQVASLSGSRLRSERSLRFSQRKLLSCLNLGEWNTLEDVARIANVNYREALLIVKKLTLVGMLETVIYQTGNEREKVRIKLKVANFYKILLTSNIGEFHNLKKQFDRKATRYKAKPKSKFTTKFIREQLDKQDYKCYLSGLPLDSYNTEAEHLLPLGKKHNGDHLPENIVFVRKELKSLKRECSMDEIVEICKAIVKLHG